MTSPGVVSVIARRAGRDWSVYAVAAGQGLAAASADGPPAARALGAMLSLGLLSLLMRRTQPLAAAALVVAVVVVDVAALPQANPAPAFVAVMMATYRLGRTASRLSVAMGLVWASVGVCLAQSAAPPSQYSRLSALAFIVSALVLLPAGAGVIVRIRASLAGRLAKATAALRKAQNERIAAAVLQDRRRIVHDVEAAILAGLEAIGAEDPAAGLAAVATIETAARQTLARMRAMVTSLRSDAGSDPDANAARAARVALRERALSLLRRTDAVAADDLAGNRHPEAFIGAVRWLLPSPIEVDMFLLAVAAFVTVGGLAEAAGWHGRPWLRLTLPVVVGFSVALARRQPVAATAATALAMISWAAACTPTDPTSGFMVTGLLTIVPMALAMRAGPRTWLLEVGGCAAIFAVMPLVDTSASFHAADVVPAVAIALACGGVGRILRMQTALVASLTSTLDALHIEQTDLARARLAVERADIARDLHDAVGHALTVIALQAAAARRVWEPDPDLAAAHVRDLGRAIDDAFTELRPIVVALTLGEGDHHVGLSDLAALADRGRLAGLSINLDLPPPPPAFPAATAQAIYRIMQESLTNAARHAPGSAVSIKLQFAPNVVSIAIDNGPSTTPAPVAMATGGSGLHGMRVRAARCGGTLHASAKVDGGFRVAARIPIQAER